MQIANVIISLDAHNTVPLYGVTVSEVAVLRVIHGEEAVKDIDITGEVKRTHRQEIGRLTEKYKRVQPDGTNIAPAVAMLFPGAAARVFEHFDELELPDEFFIATRRRTARDPLDHDNDGRKGGSLPRPATDDINDMTVNQLRDYAEVNGVDLTGVTRKADILEAIRLHTPGKTADAPADEPEHDDEDDAEDDDGSAIKDDLAAGDDENLFE